VKMPIYARSGCDQIGTKGCSACLKEVYCSGECQKDDWKAHKMMCKLIQQMSDAQQPLKDVCLAVNKVMSQSEKQIAKLGRGNISYCVSILRHLLSTSLGNGL
jgi:hypothetical protein